MSEVGLQETDGVLVDTDTDSKHIWQENMPNLALQNLLFFHSYILWYKEGGGGVTKMLILAHIGGAGGPEGVKFGSHDIWTAPYLSKKYWWKSLFDPN